MIACAVGRPGIVSRHRRECVETRGYKSELRCWGSPFLPVGSAVDLRVNLGLLLLQHPPGRRGDKELFVDAVAEAVRDPACGESRGWASAEARRLKKKKTQKICEAVSYVPVMALRISVAAASRISSDACSLYQAVWGVQIKLGASFNGP